MAASDTEVLGRPPSPQLRQSTARAFARRRTVLNCWSSDARMEPHGRSELAIWALAKLFARAPARTPVDPVRTITRSFNSNIFYKLYFESQETTCSVSMARIPMSTAKATVAPVLILDIGRVVFNIAVLKSSRACLVGSLCS